MSTAVEVTIQRLLAVDAVTAIVGEDINPDTATASLPSIALESISNKPWEGLARSSGTSQARVTVKLRTGDALTMSDLGDAVIEGLSRVKAEIQGRACSWMMAGSDVTRWSDDASVCERLIDWTVTYSKKAGA
jgi:hypothetical protein